MTLWTTISQFYDKFAVWMNGPFYKLNPEDVDAETNDAFRCVHQWHFFKVTRCTSSKAAGAALPA